MIKVSLGCVGVDECQILLQFVGLGIDECQILLQLVGLAYRGKDIVFRVIIEHSSLRDFGIFAP
jgi:hypothetical protein